MAGRPWKYNVLIDALKDDVLYHMSGAVRFCEKLGYFDHDWDDRTKELTEDDKKAAIKRARGSLGNFASKFLPKNPDGYVSAEKPSRAKYPAWYGRTWKKALKK